MAHVDRVVAVADDIDGNAGGRVENVDRVVAPAFRVDNERRRRVPVIRSDVVYSLAHNRNIEVVSDISEDAFGELVRGEQSPLLEVLQLKPAFAAQNLSPCEGA